VIMNQQHRAPRGAVPPVTLGLRIRMALDYAGLSQEHLMSRFEVSRATVSRWCRDVEPAPKKFVLNEIAVDVRGVAAMVDRRDSAGEPSPSRGPAKRSAGRLPRPDRHTG
jgi:transcriptional regulator with XRE-family HTH domain